MEVRIENSSDHGSKRKPIKLVEAAVKLMRQEARQAQRNGLKKEFWPQVWCLFDRDQHESIERAMKLAKEADVAVAFLHPCFEVWRLLHHKPVTGTFGGVCDQATTRLPFAKQADNVKIVLPEQITKKGADSFAEAKLSAPSG
ncbi:hypothetical protein N566_21995 [Streptomycetaceae bacterium MP113-05]|nr:hypothetical protein N566_21995 [Streptomycetaceae bacterium MP113-05]